MIKYGVCIYAMVISSLVCAGDYNLWWIADSYAFGMQHPFELASNCPQTNSQSKIVNAWIEYNEPTENILIKSNVIHSTMQLESLPYDSGIVNREQLPIKKIVEKKYGLQIYNDDQLVLLLNKLQTLKFQKQKKCYLSNTSNMNNNHYKNVWFEIDLENTNFSAIINCVDPMYRFRFLKTLIPIGIMAVCLTYALRYYK